MERGNLVDEAIKEIQDWLKQTGVPPYKLGNMACNNPRAVDRVFKGRGSVDALRAIYDFIKANPDGV